MFDLDSAVEADVAAVVGGTVAKGGATSKAPRWTVGQLTASTTAERFTSPIRLADGSLAEGMSAQSEAATKGVPASDVEALLLCHPLHNRDVTVWSAAAASGAHFHHTI
jgi:hypothetical protein